MSLHITRFVDRLQGFEARGQKEFAMPIADAKALHADLTRLLNELVELRESLANKPKEEVVMVEMTGGSF